MDKVKTTNDESYIIKVGDMSVRRIGVNNFSDNNEVTLSEGIWYRGLEETVKITDKLYEMGIPHKVFKHKISTIVTEHDPIQMMNHELMEEFFKLKISMLTD